MPYLDRDGERPSLPSSLQRSGDRIVSATEVTPLARKSLWSLPFFTVFTVLPLLPSKIASRRFSRTISAGNSLNHPMAKAS